MATKQTRPRLSKAILEMKFMQRTKVKVDKELEEAEGRAMYSSEFSERMLSQSSSNFIHEPSFIYCEGLIEGRLSFRGMNPDIERLLELEQEERQATHKQEQPKEVSDAEMTQFYYAQQAPAAAKTMNKKFQTKRKLANDKKDNRAAASPGMSGGGNGLKKMKTKFLKPRDDD